MHSQFIEKLKNTENPQHSWIESQFEDSATRDPEVTQFLADYKIQRDVFITRMKYDSCGGEPSVILATKLYRSLPEDTREQHMVTLFSDLEKVASSSLTQFIRGFIGRNGYLEWTEEELKEQSSKPDPRYLFKSYDTALSLYLISRFPLSCRPRDIVVAFKNPEFFLLHGDSVMAVLSANHDDDPTRHDESLRQAYGPTTYESLRDNAAIQAEIINSYFEKQAIMTAGVKFLHRIMTMRFHKEPPKELIKLIYTTLGDAQYNEFLTKVLAEDKAKAEYCFTKMQLDCLETAADSRPARAASLESKEAEQKEIEQRWIERCDALCKQFTFDALLTPYENNETVLGYVCPKGSQNTQYVKLYYVVSTLQYLPKNIASLFKNNPGALIDTFETLSQGAQTSKMRRLLCTALFKAGLEDHSFCTAVSLKTGATLLHAGISHVDIFAETSIEKLRINFSTLLDQNGNTLMHLAASDNPRFLMSVLSSMSSFGYEHYGYRDRKELLNQRNNHGQTVFQIAFKTIYSFPLHSNNSAQTLYWLSLRDLVCSNLRLVDPPAAPEQRIGALNSALKFYEGVEPDVLNASSSHKQAFTVLCKDQMERLSAWLSITSQELSEQVAALHFAEGSLVKPILETLIKQQQEKEKEQAQKLKQQEEKAFVEFSPDEKKPDVRSAEIKEPALADPVRHEEKSLQREVNRKEAATPPTHFEKKGDPLPAQSPERESTWSIMKRLGFNRKPAQEFSANMTVALQASTGPYSLKAALYLFFRSYTHHHSGPKKTLKDRFSSMFSSSSQSYERLEDEKRTTPRRLG